jgi:hypothetical protein
VSFLLYIAGFLIVIGGLIYGAVLVHLPLHWIVVGSRSAFGRRDFDRRQGHATEGPGGITIGIVRKRLARRRQLRGWWAVAGSNRGPPACKLSG